MTAPVNSRDLIMQVVSPDVRGTQVYSWDNIINKPSSGGDQVITDSEFPKGTLDGWRPYSGTTSISVVLGTHTSVPSGATSRYVCKYATPSPTGIVAMFAARKALTDVGSEMDGFPVSVGQQWYVNVRAVKDASFSAAYFSVVAYFYNKDASLTSQTVLAMYPTLTTSWADFGASFTIPANAVRCWLYVTSNITAGNVFWSQLKCNRKSSSAYYVDGSITANTLYLTGKGAELNLDVNCKDLSAWTMLTGSGLSIDSAVTDNNVTGGSYALQSSSGTAVRAFCTELIQLDQLKNYRISLAMKQQTATAANCYLSIVWYDAAGNQITASTPNPAGWTANGSYSYWPGYTAPLVPATSWTRYVASFGPTETAKSPSTAYFFRIGVMMNYNNTVNGIVKISGVSVQEKADASLVVDGAITAAKVSVTSMSAISADLGTVTAGSITLPANATSHIKAGKTSYAHTAAGYYLGYDSSAHKFKIGNSTKSFSWDGTDVILDNAGIDTGTSGYIKGGKTSYADTAAGYFLGYDSSAYKLKIGNSTKYITWDGSNLVVTGGAITTGSLIAEQIEAGGLTTVYSASATGTATCQVASISIPSGCRSIVVMGFFSVIERAYTENSSGDPKGGGGGSVTIYTWGPCFGTVSNSYESTTGTGYGSGAFTLLNPSAGTYTFNSVRETGGSNYSGKNTIVVIVTRR